MKREDFSNAKLGLFIHWGLYSVLGRGEWAMYRERIAPAEYAKLADRFNPRNFTPESWCIAAKKAGFRYAVFTTCHHDGFALFDSSADSFNSMNSSAHRDFVAEYVEACRKHGLGVGLYCSLGDWRFGIMKESDSAENAARMRELTHRRIRELMSNYGKIDILWYDGGWCYPSLYDHGPDDVKNFWQAEKLNAMVRALQPEILINDRSGIPEDFGTAEGMFACHNGKRLLENCYTLGDNINSHWGYFRNQKYRKTPAIVMSILIKTLATGSNLLLNVGPDEQGVIPDWQQTILDSIGEWIKRNGEAVYGIRVTDVSQDRNYISGNEFCCLAEKSGVYYCYFQDFPDRETFIPVMKKQIVRAEFLNGSEVKAKMRGGGLFLSGLPEMPPDPLCSVLKLIPSD